MRSGTLLVLVTSLGVFGQGVDPKTPLAGKTPFDWAGLKAPFNRDLDATVTLKDGQTLLFKGDRYALFSRSRSDLTTGAMASLPGWPKGWEVVDAAARWTDTTVVLFNGGSYILYDFDKRRFSQIGNVTGWRGWPSGWADGIDAALEGSNATLYLFRGNQYITLDKANAVVSAGPLSVQDWKGWPSRWIDGIDSADNPGDGYLYFFRGSEILAYDLKKARFVKGYPKQMPGAPAAETAQAWPPLDQNLTDPVKRPLEWKNLPAPFNAGVRAAVSVDKERILLFKDDKYVLYFHHRDSKGNEVTKVESSGSLSSILPSGWTKVHAAAKWNDSSIVLFHEGKYVRYDLHDRKMGREKNLSDIPGWPATWTDGIDAALAGDDGDTLYLFRGTVYVSLSKSQEAVIADPSSIADWTGFPSEWLDGIDGADNPGDGRSYFFRDRQVLAWDNAAARFLDGYPKDLPGAQKQSAQVWPPVVTSRKNRSDGARGERALLKFDGVAPVLKGDIDAGAPIGGDNVLLFSGSQYVIYNGKAGTISKPADLSTIKGWPAKWTKVDAAASWDDFTLLLFNGGEFIQYNMRAQMFRGSAEPVSDIPNWPAGWTDGINGAANLDDDTLYLFHGSAYVMMSKSNALVITAPQSTKSWTGWPKKWTTGPTGTVEAPDGRVYFFRGSEYLPYDPDKDTFVAKAPQQLPGTMPELALAAWPPVAPPAPQPAGPGGAGSGSGNFTTDANGNLRVTSLVPMNGATLNGITSNSLTLLTSNGNVPIAVNDPAYFDVNISPGNAGGSGSGVPGLSDATASAAIPYTDNYPVNNDFQWEIPWMSKGADYLGSGYDPLTLDPANYGDVSKRMPFQAVTVTTSFHRNPDGSLAGYCTRYSPGDTGVLTKKNTAVTTLQEYQDHFGISGSISGGVEGIGSIAVGGGYSAFNSSTNGKDEFYELQQSTIGLARLRMDLTCIDIDSNKHYRQKLDPRFRDAVKNLEDPAQPLADYQAQAPSDLGRWYAKQASSKYMQLLNDYGFVIANSVTMGGQFRSTLKITKAQAESVASNDQDFNTHMEGALEGVTIGASLDIKNGSLSKSAKATADLSAKIETSGGVPGSDFDNWAQTIVNVAGGINGSTTTGGAPVPVQAQFQPLSDLLTSYFFDDPKIADKAALLLDLINAHMLVDVDKYPIYAASDRTQIFTNTPRQYKVSVVSMSWTGASTYYDTIILSHTLGFKLLDGNANPVAQTVTVPPISDSLAGLSNVNAPGTYGVDGWEFYDANYKTWEYKFAKQFLYDKEFVYLQAPKGYYVHFYGHMFDWTAVKSRNPAFSEVLEVETAIDPTQDVDLDALGASKKVDLVFTSSSEYNRANSVTVTFEVLRTQ